VVCLYRERSSGRPVVVKHISAQQMSREEREQSLNEARVLAMLHHPNIVAYYDSFLEDAQSLAIVMEYAPGGTLHDYLRRRGEEPLPEQQVLSFLGQIVLALEHVHSRQILHRDLKTQNLLLDRHRALVKVGDFGISKVLSSRSKANSLVGTPNNISPEICVGKPYNQKSDIWALGCVLYELLTLRCPFEGSNVGDVLMRVMRGSYAPPGDACPPALRQLLERLLQREPSLRPSARQLLAHPVLLTTTTRLALSTGSL
ncbi:unnamed protein product, partial [Ixodes hexagonus]